MVILSGLVGLANLVLFVMVLVKLFQEEGVGRGSWGSSARSTPSSGAG